MFYSLLILHLNRMLPADNQPRRAARCPRLPTFKIMVRCYNCGVVAIPWQEGDPDVKCAADFIRAMVIQCDHCDAYLQAQVDGEVTDRDIERWEWANKEAYKRPLEQ